MSEGLSRREVLTAGAAFLLAPACTSSRGLSDTGVLDTAMQDRHEMLIDALLAEDLDALLDASREELDELGKDSNLVAVVPDGHHILCTAAFWGYMKKNAVRAGRPFELPQEVIDGLHRKIPVVKDPLTGTYGII